MIPKIIFRYSQVHDKLKKDHLRLYYKVKKDPRTKKLLENYPSRRKIRNYIKRIEPHWKKDEKKILKEISKITGLKWKEKQIKVYIIGSGTPYSDPLTMKLYSNQNDFVDTLTHELIHQIQSQNFKDYKKWALYLKKTYKNEVILTKRHILLHAVHKELYLNIFNEKRLKRNINRSSIQSYKRAWEIVESEGQKSIINKFKKIIKSKK